MISRFGMGFSSLAWGCVFGNPVVDDQRMMHVTIVIIFISEPDLSLFLQFIVTYCLTAPLPLSLSPQVI